ncbi:MULTISPECIES: hypothetical protein [Microbacterium]|jgi:hypothetical protein|uniref:hypothetical protein n=1 Tax=Microbacterium TaxID=33882 RepID=UPI0003DE68C8|nr:MULTISPECIES: hypothetical protein [Microbacterium]MDO8381451.1 hypothetical protein [Microbacterium sp.]CDK01727.1 conserved exported hypothetical protein [Microbacterium sp. C448]
MIAPVSSRPSSILSERLLITKIITSVALAFFLILGAWVSTHSEQEAAAPVPVGVALIDSHVEAPAPAVQTIVSTYSGTDSLWGIAVCAFGVLCGLLLVLMATNWFHSRGRPTHANVALAMTRVLLLAPPLPRKVALSLTQLSISRT